MSTKRTFLKDMWVRDTMNGYIGLVVKVEPDHAVFVTSDNLEHRVLKRNLVIINSKMPPTPSKGQPSVDEFLRTLKIHNKDLDVCFNDAIAVHHLKELMLAHALSLLPEKKYVGVKNSTYANELGYNQALTEVEQKLQASYE